MSPTSDQNRGRSIDRTLNVAPMMSYTDRHFRYLLRLLSPNAVLYTEMITAQAILNRRDSRLLAFDPREKPLALQVGGCDPAQLAQCARIAESMGYDEINLNVGCPSPRVTSGAFGACLMREPTLVADCVRAMRDACAIDVTVKCRLGVDADDSDEFLYEFIDYQVQAGIAALVVHARIARLDGLSPEENREIPPLLPQRVYAIKQRLPHQTIVLNGGILGGGDEATIVPTHLRYVDGVMLGRAVLRAPYVLATLEQLLFAKPIPHPHWVLGEFSNYIAAQMAQGVATGIVARRALNLFTGIAGSRAFRRAITTAIQQRYQGADLLLRAAESLRFDEPERHSA